MISFSDLNPHSQRFARLLFDQYPEWQALARVNPWANADIGCFAVEVPSPASHSHCLCVDTDGGEVTVGFGAHGWHTHFGPWTGDDELTTFTEAMSYIGRLLSEELVVADGFEKGEARWSETTEPHEEPDFSHADRIEITSWNGTYNRTFTPPAHP